MMMKPGAEPPPPAPLGRVPPQGVVTLLSGGLDSAVMVGRTLAQGRPVWPLYVRQGALWEDAEETAIRRFLPALARRFPDLLQPLTVLRLELPKAYASRWAFDPATAPPGGQSPAEAVYLPGRNLALFLQGALLAQSLGLIHLQIGHLAGNPFADSTALFREAFIRTYALATGHRLQIEAPLAHCTKAEVIRLGREFPLAETLSCLRPLPVGGPTNGDPGRPVHCGQCNKCTERRRGFAAAGMPDPTLYTTPSAVAGEAD